MKFKHHTRRSYLMSRKVFHFDINYTITAVDSTEPGTNVEQANTIIARNAYGKIVNGEWIMNNYFTDEKDSVTYYSFLKKYHASNYKELSSAFTKPKHPGSSLNYLVNQICQSMKGFLFESFVKVLEMYPDVLIVLRSFGKEIPNVLNFLEQKRYFRMACAGLMNHNEEGIRLLMDNGTIYTGMDRINNLYATTTTNLAIQEDYQYWNSHQRLAAYGKTMQCDEKLFQIFFDDNEWVNIIHEGTGKCHYVKVNTLAALLDENYFVDIIGKLVKD